MNQNGACENAQLNNTDGLKVCTKIITLSPNGADLTTPTATPHSPSTSTALNPSSPFIIQNGTIYQVTANNQLIPRNNLHLNQIVNSTTNQTFISLNEQTNTEHPTTTTQNKQLIVNSSPNLTPNVILPTTETNRIKMIKNGTILNLTTNSKGKVIYKTGGSNNEQTTTAPQQQLKTVNLYPSSPSAQKQILITNNSSTNSSSKLSALINNSGQQNQSKPQSIIVLTPRNNSLNDQPQNIQFLLQQSQQQQQQPKSDQFLTNNNSNINLQQKLYLPITSTLLTQLKSPSCKVQTLQLNKPEQISSIVNTQQQQSQQTIQYILSSNNEIVLAKDGLSGLSAESNKISVDTSSIQVNEKLDGNVIVLNGASNLVNMNSPKLLQPINASKKILQTAKQEGAEKLNELGLLKSGNNSSEQLQQKPIEIHPNVKVISLDANNIIKDSTSAIQFESNANQKNGCPTKATGTNSAEPTSLLTISCPNSVNKKTETSDTSNKISKPRLSNNISQETIKTTPASLQTCSKANNNLITALSTPIQPLSPNSLNNKNNNALHVICNNNSSNPAQFATQGNMACSPRTQALKKAPCKNITPVLKYNQANIKPELHSPSLVNQVLSQESLPNTTTPSNRPHSQPNTPTGSDKVEIDENFIPNESYLNDLLLPDTRIFASLLNKSSKDAASSHNDKRVLTDLNYKTVLIGNSEHIIIDNLNNLADFRGEFGKLQSLACAVANKLNKPVTIPAFLLIDQKYSVEKVKEILAENNISPIIIDTTANSVPAETSEPLDQPKPKNIENENETIKSQENPPPPPPPVQQNTYIIQSLNKETLNNSNVSTNTTNNNSQTSIEAQPLNNKTTVKKQSSCINKRRTSKSKDCVSMKINQINDSSLVEDQPQLEQQQQQSEQPPAQKKARKQKTIKDISSGQYLSAINSDQTKTKLAIDNSHNNGLITYSTNFSTNRLPHSNKTGLDASNSASVSDGTQVINLSEQPMENLKFVTDSATAAPKTTASNNEKKNLIKIVNKSTVKQTINSNKNDNDFVNNVSKSNVISNKANGLITFSRTIQHPNTDNNSNNVAPSNQTGNCVNQTNNQNNEFNDFNFDTFDSNVLFNLNEFEFQ